MKEYSLCYKVGDVAFRAVSNSAHMLDTVQREVWVDKSCSVVSSGSCRFYLSAPGFGINLDQFGLRNVAATRPQCIYFCNQETQESVALINSSDDYYSVRWLMMSSAARFLEGCGRIVMHATTVDLSGFGVLIIGPKNSGKSSLALALVQWGGARLVADDASFVHVDNRVIRACGVFRGMNINESTLRYFRRGFAVHLILDDHSEVKTRIVLNRCRSLETTKIGLILFPHVRRSMDCGYWCTPNTKARILENVIFGPANRHNKCAEAMESQLITSKVAAYDLALGVDIRANCMRVLELIGELKEESH